MLAATPDAERRLPLLREAAQVRFARLGDPARAIPLFEAASAIATSDAELALSLADAMDATERYRDATKVLRQQLASSCLDLPQQPLFDDGDHPGQWKGDREIDEGNRRQYLYRVERARRDVLSDVEKIRHANRRYQGAFLE